MPDAFVEGARQLKGLGTEAPLLARCVTASTFYPQDPLFLGRYGCVECQLLNVGGGSDCVLRVPLLRFVVDLSVLWLSSSHAMPMHEMYHNHVDKKISIVDLFAVSI